MRKRKIALLMALSMVASVPMNAMTVSAEEAPEEVTLTVYMNPSGYLTSGIQNDAVAQAIKEKTGVTLDIVAEETDKTKAIVASGDLYDISVLDNVEYISPLISTDSVADLSEWIEKAPNLTGNFSELINYSKEYLSNDSGNLYVLPMRAKADNSPLAKDMDGNFIQWDQYVEAGSPEITSVDDLIDLLETIQNNNPENENGQKAYALSAWSDWGAGSFASPLQKVLGLSGTSLYSSYSYSDNEYQDLFNDDNLYLQYAEFMYKANQRGLVDPEAFVQKYEDYSAKLMDGRVLTSMYAWAVSAKSAALEKEGKAGFVDIPFADTEEFPSQVNRDSVFGYSLRLLVVSKDCDDTKMEAIMRLLNFIYSEDGARTMLNGPEGTTWTKDDNGNAVFTEETMAAVLEDSSYLTNFGADYYLGLMGIDYDAYDSTGERYIDLRLNKDYIQQTLKDYEREYCEHYGVEIPLDVFVNRENQSTQHISISMLYPTEVPTNISRIKTKVEDYMLKELPVLILSENQEAYDANLAEMREELTAMDYETARDYYKEVFENAVASYNELTK